MINISVDISLKCLDLVCQRINLDGEKLSKDPKDKAAQLILLELYHRLINKYHAKVVQPKRKPFKLNLKYYSAYALKEALLLSRTEDPEQVIVNAFILKLDQKLQC